MPPEKKLEKTAPKEANDQQISREDFRRIVRKMKEIVSLVLKIQNSKPEKRIEVLVKRIPLAPIYYYLGIEIRREKIRAKIAKQNKEIIADQTKTIIVNKLLPSIPRIIPSIISFHFDTKTTPHQNNPEEEKILQNSPEHNNTSDQLGMMPAKERNIDSLMKELDNTIEMLKKELDQKKI